MTLGIGIRRNPTVEAMGVVLEQPHQGPGGLLGRAQAALLREALEHRRDGAGGLTALALHVGVDGAGAVDEAGDLGLLGSELKGEVVLGGLGRAVGAPAREPTNTATPPPWRARLG